jgi:endonuclease YncB( thermonuclease family)
MQFDLIISKRSMQRACRIAGIVALMITLAALAWFWSTPKATVQFSPGQTLAVVRVTGVVDGDTLKVRDPQYGLINVRLFGIDCPEHDQPYGAEATAFTRKTILAKDVALTVKGQDKWGRFIAQVKTDESILNEQLLEHGLAWWSYKYAPGILDYQRFEANARAARIGLWSDTNAISPWAWRDAQKHLESQRSH